MDVLEKLKQEEAELDKQFLGLEEEPTPDKDGDADLSTGEPEVLEAQGEEDVVVEEPVVLEDPPEEKPVEEKKKRVSWKQRHINFKTHADVTIRDLRIAAAQNATRLEELMQTVSDQNKEMMELKESIEKGKDPYEGIITQEDRDLLGDEAVDLIKRVGAQRGEGSSAQAEYLEKEAKALREERLRVAKEREDELQAQKTNSFNASLAKIVPDFEEVNVDPNFMTYLNGIDPLSGKPRMEFFSTHVQAGDIYGTARFFQDFVSQKPKSKEEILSKKITPTGAGASEHRPPEDGREKLHEFGEYEKFMDDITKGLYKGREKEARKIEAMYDRVFAEDRFI